ncbi:MAG: YkgJ family cysteine cluster protein [Acidobacteria bacterium]|nr:YkgJ family cysteine cluster protein [Acidobacteriota bacterium]
MKNIRRRIGELDRETIDRVGALFAEVDRAVEKFRKLTGIKCPDGCGECCSRSRVETTVVEMMPLALELWRNNTAEYWMSRIYEAPDDPVCIFYKAQPGSSTRGRCTAYPMRPLICRLFGFFTVRNKYGKYVYGSCRVIKQKYPEVYEKAVSMLDEINHPSVCTDYSIRMIGMDSMLGSSMLPINRAASVALEKIGYRLEGNDCTGLPSRNNLMAGQEKSTPCSNA